MKYRFRRVAHLAPEAGYEIVPDAPAHADLPLLQGGCQLRRADGKRFRVVVHTPTGDDVPLEVLRRAEDVARTVRVVADPAPLQKDRSSVANWYYVDKLVVQATAADASAHTLCAVGEPGTDDDPTTIGTLIVYLGQKALLPPCAYVDLPKTICADRKGENKDRHHCTESSCGSLHVCNLSEMQTFTETISAIRKQDIYDATKGVLNAGKHAKITKSKTDSQTTTVKHPNVCAGDIEHSFGSGGIVTVIKHPPTEKETTLNSATLIFDLVSEWRYRNSDGRPMRVQLCSERGLDDGTSAGGSEIDPPLPEAFPIMVTSGLTEYAVQYRLTFSRRCNTTRLNRALTYRAGFTEQSSSATLDAAAPPFTPHNGGPKTMNPQAAAWTPPYTGGGYDPPPPPPTPPATVIDEFDTIVLSLTHATALAATEQHRDARTALEYVLFSKGQGHRDTSTPSGDDDPTTEVASEPVARDLSFQAFYLLRNNYGLECLTSGDEVTPVEFTLTDTAALLERNPTHHGNGTGRASPLLPPQIAFHITPRGSDHVFHNDNSNNTFGTLFNVPVPSTRYCFAYHQRACWDYRIDKSEQSNPPKGCNKGDRCRRLHFPASLKLLKFREPGSVNVCKDFMSAATSGGTNVNAAPFVPGGGNSGSSNKRGPMTTATQSGCPFSPFSCAYLHGPAAVLDIFKDLGAVAFIAEPCVEKIACIEKIPEALLLPTSEQEPPEQDPNADEDAKSVVMRTTITHRIHRQRQWFVAVKSTQPWMDVRRCCSLHDMQREWLREDFACALDDKTSNNNLAKEEGLSAALDRCGEIANGLSVSCLAAAVERFPKLAEESTLAREAMEATRFYGLTMDPLLCTALLPTPLPPLPSAISPSKAMDAAKSAGGWWWSARGGLPSPNAPLLALGLTTPSAAAILESQKDGHDYITNAAGHAAAERAMKARIGATVDKNVHNDSSYVVLESDVFIFVCDKAQFDAPVLTVEESDPPAVYIPRSDLVPLLGPKPNVCLHRVDDEHTEARMRACAHQQQQLTGGSYGNDNHHGHQTLTSNPHWRQFLPGGGAVPAERMPPPPHSSHNPPSAVGYAAAAKHEPKKERLAPPPVGTPTSTPAPASALQQMMGNMFGGGAAMPNPQLQQQLMQQQLMQQQMMMMMNPSMQLMMLQQYQQQQQQLMQMQMMALQLQQQQPASQNGTATPTPPSAQQNAMLQHQNMFAAIPNQQLQQQLMQQQLMQQQMMMMAGGGLGMPNAAAFNPMFGAPTLPSLFPAFPAAPVGAAPLPAGVSSEMFGALPTAFNPLLPPVASAETKGAPADPWAAPDATAATTDETKLQAMIEQMQRGGVLAAPSPAATPTPAFHFGGFGGIGGSNPTTNNIFAAFNPVSSQDVDQVEQATNDFANSLCSS